jgi:hypothetical protein
MTTYQTTSLTGPIAARRHPRSRWLTTVAALVGALFAAHVVAQAPVAPTAAAAVPSEQDLETLVGPIALYPDDLVAIILPASTNPLQIVQADRFLDKRKADPKAPVDEKWDEAVKSLLTYPEVVKKMSSDLDWTAALGEAVVADSGEVMAAVQAFRRKVNAAGNLKTDDKQKVVVEKEVITIVQSNPEVIYVPQYNPSTVVVYGGYSSWGYYPSPYPVYYYPYAPGAAFAAGVVWGAAMGAIWSGGHYGCGWGNNDININRNTNINVDRTNISGGNRPSQGGGSSQWKSNKQPGQVSNSVGKTAPSARAGDARGGGGGASASTRAGDSRGGGGAGAGGGGAGAGAGGARPSTQPSAGAGRDSATRSQPSSATRDGGGSAFDGGGSSGRQAQMDSSRGASSRSSMSSGASARPSPSPSSGGARAGGGGGGGARAGGGGGGGRRR